MAQELVGGHLIFGCWDWQVGNIVLILTAGVGGSLVSLISLTLVSANGSPDITM